MTIKIVVKYARYQASRDRETYRQAALTIELQNEAQKTLGLWATVGAQAEAGRRPGERVVSISEAGYH